MSELKSAKFIIDNTPVGFIQEIDDNLKSLNSHLEESKELFREEDIPFSI